MAQLHGWMELLQASRAEGWLLTTYTPEWEEEGGQHPGVPRCAISEIVCPCEVAMLPSSCATKQSLDTGPSPRCGWGLFLSKARHEPTCWVGGFPMQRPTGQCGLLGERGGAAISMADLSFCSNMGVGGGGWGGKAGPGLW